MLKRRSRRYVPAAARAADAAGARSGKGDLDDVDRFFDSDACASEQRERQTALKVTVTTVTNLFLAFCAFHRMIRRAGRAARRFERVK